MAETDLEAPGGPVETISPAGGVETAPPPEKAPTAAHVKPGDALSGLLERYTSMQAALSESYGPLIRDASKAVTGAETEAAKTSERVLRPAIEGVKASASVPVPPLPKMVPEPPVPDRRARPFLANKDGESAVSAIVTGLGLLAQLAMGGRAPVTALHAMTGAMNGWAAGDAVRADREWQQYLRTVDLIRHENAHGLKLWEAAMSASGTNMLQAEARYKAATAEAGLSDKWAAVAQGGMGRLLETLKYEQGLINGVFDRSAKVLELQAMHELRAAHDRQTAEFRQQQLELQGRRQDETERSNREKEAAKLRAANDFMKLLPAPVRSELMGNADSYGRIMAGETPTQAQIDAANASANRRSVDRAAAVGRDAADRPQRTPTESMKRLEDLTSAQAYIGEMDRLTRSPNVRLDMVLGGLRPLINQKIQTRRLGPFPLPQEIAQRLSPDELRFIAVTQDYADALLRVRSGASTTEPELQRMVTGFVPEQSVTPEAYRARLELQDDLLSSKKGIILDYLEAGGYRAPKVTPSPVKKPEGALSPPKPGMVRARRKADGRKGWISPEDVGDKYEAIGGR